MKNTSNHTLISIAAIMLLQNFLVGCASNWALNPRDRSIKKWEAEEKRKKEMLKEVMATDTTYFYFDDSKLNKR